MINEILMQAFDELKLPVFYISKGIGGLRWEIVKPIMEKYLSGLADIEVIICLDELNQAEGIEKRMLDDINSMSFEQIKDYFKLNKRQSEVIEKYLPLDRFWKLSKLPSIGEKTYEKMFLYFYTKCNDKKVQSNNIIQE